MKRIFSSLSAFVLLFSTFMVPFAQVVKAEGKGYDKVVLRGNASALDWDSDKNPLTYNEIEGVWKSKPINLPGGKEVEYKFVMDENWMEGENLKFTPHQTGDYIFIFSPADERRVDVKLDFTNFTGKLTLNVSLPAGTPEWATPTIGSTLNGFNYSVTSLTKTDDGNWTVTLAGNENVTIEYLYALGDAKLTENRIEKRKATFTKEGSVYQDTVEAWKDVPVAKDVNHNYSFSPALPSSNEEVTIAATVKHFGSVNEGALYYTIDGKMPAGIRGLSEEGEVVKLIPETASTENGITTTIFKGIIPKQQNGTPIKYIIDVWDKEGVGSQYADSNSLKVEDATQFAYYVDDFKSPQWAKDATIYHIFVDRFNDGDKTNNGSVDTTLPYDEQLKGWMGGDLKGVLDKIDYISDLGVNTIWISPVFKGPYSHGYHPMDFKAIDERFGDPETMKQLIDGAHAKNMKVVYDFVPNHTSSQHPYFQDAQTKGTSSPYFNWYSFEEWPNKYKTFSGISELPELNNENGGVRDYVLNDVVPHWLTELNFDGFRLDYAKGPSYSYWVDFRHKVKQMKPNAYIFGEIWDSREKINSYAGELDGALDFVMNDALVNTFAKNQSMVGLSDTIKANLDTYPKEYVVSSFLDSHDKPRFLFEAGGDVNKLMLAAATQFTLPGSPVIYYGDEVGLSQSKDHNSVSDWKDRYYRELMPWDEAKQNTDLKNYYKKLINIRNDESALRTGEFQKLYVDQDVFAFEREDENGQFLIVVNKGSESKEIDVNQLFNQSEIIDVTLKDVLGTETIENDEGGDITFTSEGKGFEIYEVEGSLEYSDQPIDNHKIYSEVVLRGSEPLAWSGADKVLTYDDYEKIWKSESIPLKKGEVVDFKFVRDGVWMDDPNLTFTAEYSDNYIFIFDAMDQRKVNVQLAEEKVTTKVKVHYQPKAGDTKDWNLWAWAEGMDGKAYPFTGEDKFGKIAEIELEGDHNRVGFIVRTDSWEKDGGDRWMEDVWYGQDEVWIKSGDEKVYLSPPDGEYRDLLTFDELEVTFNYYRYDSDYKDWDIWIWTDKSEGQALPLPQNTSFGKKGTIKLSNLNGASKVGFIVRKSDWSAKDMGEDRFVTKFTDDGKAEVWLAQGQKRIFDNPAKIDRNPRIVKATIDELNQISFETNLPFVFDKGENPGITLNGAEIEKVEATGELNAGMTNKVKVVTKNELDLTKVYTISKEGFGEATVQMGKVIGSESFEERFYYNENDLGNTYKKEETKFRLWAPTASEAKLVTYEKGDSTQGTELQMTRGEKGTWTATLPGDQKGLLYTYKVKIGDSWNEAVDPYVRAVAVNGDKGAVVDLNQTKPQNWKNEKPAFKNPEDAIIYETHIRDLSIHPDSGISSNYKGKYLGVAQTGTKGPGGVKTGLDYIKDLGVSHVQFIPMYDYNTASVDETKLDQPQYNWGYDPKNYNVPEGSYSTDPYNPTVRINEMKQMIQTLHDNNLRVVMDVVYNHMFNAFESNLHKLVPGYYFRYNEDGTLANGTGVGNDTASEHKMMRKFIVDSVTYWAKEYNIDGFRFDLMGIHDVETMNQVRAALDEIDPSIIVIGEGWDLNTPLDPAQKANQKNASKMEGIAHFNDDIRDGLKGSVFEESDKGFVNGKSNMELRVKKGVVGGVTYSDTIKTFSDDPEQTVTYVEAHDNHTLWDKLVLTNGDDSVEVRKKMHKLASSIILTSQGVSFIHAGQEFMRTKNGDHNSYKSPDAINQIDWSRSDEFKSELEYFKGLIKLRQSHPAFRMTTEEDINENLSFLPAPNNAVAFVIKGNANGDTAGKIAVAYNANRTPVEIELPSNGKWNLLANGVKAGIEVLEVIKGNKITVPALSTYVLALGGDDKPGENPGEKPEDEKPILIKPTVKNGIAIIENKELEKALDGVGNTKNPLTLDFGKEESVKVEFTKEQVEQIKQKGIPLLFKNEWVEVLIPSNNIVSGKTLAFGMKSLREMKEAVSPVYDFTLYLDGKQIHHFNEPVTLQFAIDLSKVKTTSDLNVYFYNEEKKQWELIPGASYKEGWVTVTTNHFSIYAVFEVAPNDTNNMKDVAPPQVGEKMPNTATSNYNLLLVGSILFLIGSILLHYRRRNETK